MATVATPRRVRVAVLGAGMSGLCAGIQLRKSGIDDFVILEKADRVGGTWRENTYPGVACDVPSHVYSFSFELNPDWSHSYSGGPEIQAYCERCVEKYDLARHLELGTEVRSARFDGQRWQVETADETLEADVVVSGLGGLHLPSHADLPGFDRFQGTTFHTAEWNHDHDLTGRRVAIIGTGASAAQVLPAIAERVEHTTVFQRSPAWVFPRLAQGISDRRRELFRRYPWLMRGYRWMLWSLMDVFGVWSLRRTGAGNERIRRRALAHLEAQVRDPELRRKLTPDYDPGCKRRCISDDYLATFNRDDVDLVTTPIATIEENGIRDTDGVLHEVDTIVQATGFRPFDISDYLDVSGRDGLSLRDAWQEKVETFRTMMVPGFPNFFLLLGPNSATGHTSALIMIESQVRYVVRCLELMDRHELSQLDPDPGVVATWNRRIQRDMGRMVFSGGCNAWYTDRNDHNFTLWPYSAARFVIEQWAPRRAEFLDAPASASADSH